VRRKCIGHKRRNKTNGWQRCAAAPLRPEVSGGSVNILLVLSVIKKKKRRAALSLSSSFFRENKNERLALRMLTFLNR